MLFCFSYSAEENRSNSIIFKNSFNFQSLTQKGSYKLLLFFSLSLPFSLSFISPNFFSSFVPTCPLLSIVSRHFVCSTPHTNGLHTVFISVFFLTVCSVLSSLSSSIHSSWVSSSVIFESVSKLLLADYKLCLASLLFLFGGSLLISPNSVQSTHSIRTFV